MSDIVEIFRGLQGWRLLMPPFRSDGCDNVVMHPAYHAGSKASGVVAEFVIRVQNHAAIRRDCGKGSSRSVFAEALARVQRAISGCGVACPEGEDCIAIAVFDARIFGNSFNKNGCEDWLDELCRLLSLEPVELATGPVHMRLCVAGGRFSRVAPEVPSGAEEVSSASGLVDDTARRFRSDMTILSPVLRAIGGFAASSGDPVVDVAVCWRPIRRSGKDGGLPINEAVLGILEASGRLRPAGDVIEAAVRQGFVQLLDRYLVSSVIDEFIAAEGSVDLFVTVSTSSMCLDCFWEKAVARLSACSAAAGSITIEVRGDASVDNCPDLAIILDKLRKCGCKISFANFGVGYSSFRNIVALAPDFVTIDKYFISSSAQLRAGQAALLHLVGLVKALGADPILDGVETVEDFNVATATGVTLVKGGWAGSPAFFRPWATRCRAVV